MASSLKKCPCSHLFVPTKIENSRAYDLIHRIYKSFSCAFKLVGMGNVAVEGSTTEKLECVQVIMHNVPKGMSVHIYGSRMIDNAERE